MNERPGKRRFSGRGFYPQADLRVAGLMGGEQQLSLLPPPPPRSPVDPRIIGGPYKAPPLPEPVNRQPSITYDAPSRLAPPTPRETPFTPVATDGEPVYFEGPYKPPPAPGYVNISNIGGMQKWVPPEEGKVWMDQMEARRRSEWESAGNPTGQLYLNRMAENARARELGIAPRNDEYGRPFYVPYDFGDLIAR